jgi:hypothetical protein
MLALAEAFSIDLFLETGTHIGMTAAWAAEHFREVITIEASADLHREAAARHGGLENVRFVHGDTRSVLPFVVVALEAPAVVWLDSHWSGGGTYGEDDECPLLFEIETVRASPLEHCLFVDDARLFLAPPPRPHKLDQWPTLAQVVAALTAGERPLDVLVLDDTFIGVPAAAMPFVRQYAQTRSTLAWEQGDTPSEERSVVGTAQRFRASARSFAARLRGHGRTYGP